MTDNVIRSRVVDHIIRGDGRSHIIRGGIGPPGMSSGPGVGFMVTGPFAARAFIAGWPMAGAGSFTAAHCHAYADLPCLGVNVWSVTKSGTFANPRVATALEIAAALFATITFPAGLGDASWVFPSGSAYVDADKIRIWESASPDGAQGNTSVMFA